MIIAFTAFAIVMIGTGACLFAWGKEMEIESNYDEGYFQAFHDLRANKKQAHRQR
jgi:hypothetical protein